jgi:hypothetical protein
MAGLRHRKGRPAPRRSGPSGAGVAFILLLLLLALYVPATAAATTLEHMTVEQLAQRATLIVEGTVLSTAPDVSGGDVRTEVRLKVREAFKGAPDAVATFYVPGGATMRVDAMPAFSAGEECYVFVDVRGWVIAGFQGKLPVVGDTVLGSGLRKAAMNARIATALRPGGAGTKTEAGPAAQPPAQTAAGRGASAPVVLSVSPSSASAGTDTPVVITGAGFGSQEGWVEFTYGHDGVARIEADVSSWSDTRIECTVPTAVIKDYDASAGSGPMWVTTRDGHESLPYTFSVTFGYGDERWASPQVKYYVNTSGIDDALRESLVDAGTATWNAAGSGFTYVDGGSTTATISKDGKNVISWAWGLPDGVIAQSSSWGGSGVIKEADIRYSNDYDWGDGAPGSNTMDIQSIATHEVGHWLVLLDLYGPGDANKVMYGYGDEESVTRTLSAGDIAGITWIYPVDDTAPQVGARNATAKRNQTVKIYFRVYDDVSAQVSEKVQIKAGDGTVKKTWTYDYGENYDGWWWVKYKAALPKGSYQIVVTGTDLAGNSATATATLTVK